MALVVPKEGRDWLLRWILGIETPDNPVLHLYSNNVTINDNITTGSFVETACAGYSSISLIPASWTITSGTETKASYPKQTFSMIPITTLHVYGYYITNTAGTKLLWAQRADFAPATFPAGSATFYVTPIFTVTMGS